MPRTLIRVDDVHKAYGMNTILDGATVALQEDHKVGVIGRNGAGKSTLCRMILGEEQADAGRIVLHDELRLAWLEQKDPFLPGETVLGFLERRSGAESWRCGMLAGRFLLGQELLEREVAGLSGGYQTRVRLCAMLLREPNFLILDEPTNYLDLRTLLLLEDFLRAWDGGFLIVSHDREFLKRTCAQTLEVENGQVSFFPGNVEAWLGYKEERALQAERHNANVAARAKELQDFIDRNRAKASKATQAQSKMKMLARLQHITVEHKAATVAISIPPVEERQGTAVRLKDLAIGYPEREVARGIELEIERGRRVAVLGDNGQGKSTLLKTLAGTLPPIAGEVAWGWNIRIGHYAQHVYAAIPDTLTVQQYLEKAAAAGPVHVTSQQILDLAGAFLFRGDDVQKKVAVLSGGERSRLCLAGLLLGRFPVLLLDEPTNHLDFESVEALAEALRTYKGTLFFVSHDRTFVSLVATDVVEVKDGRVALYGDGYEHYCWRMEQELAAQEEAAERAAAPAPAAVSAPVEDKTARRLRRERAQQARNRLKTVERELAKLEQEKTALTARLAADPSRYGGPDGRRLAEVVAAVETLEAEWLVLGEQVQAGEG